LAFLADVPAAEAKAAEIRNFLPQINMGEVRTEFSPEDVHGILCAILKPLEDIPAGFSLQDEAGHGSGHMRRDLLHAVLLGTRLKDIDASHCFPAIIAGTLHDVGCFIVKRYGDAHELLRHAEVGALYVNYVLEQLGLVNTAERMAIVYGIAAHTHYLGPQTVKLKDGREVVIQPYPDMINGKPVWFVWITRWVDRLDCGGGAFVGRHFLTLLKAHQDYDGKNFYEVSFAEHLRPIRRPPEEIKAAGGKRTMAEHLQMFVDTQNNESPYGQHDFGLMVELRDAYKARLQRVIEAVLQPDDGVEPTEVDEMIVRHWLNRVEPSYLGRTTARDLLIKLHDLDPASRRAWMRGFRVASEEYAAWTREACGVMADIHVLVFPLPIFGGIADVLWMP
jgi:hypothetical protein